MTHKIIDAKIIRKEEDLMPILREGIGGVKSKICKDNVKQVKVCKNCGHDGSWHSDGINNHTGTCNKQIGVHLDTDEPLFCPCKKFEEETGFNHIEGISYPKKSKVCAKCSCNPCQCEIELEMDKKKSTEFNLISKRKELYYEMKEPLTTEEEEMLLIVVFDFIAQQDREFIKRLKEEHCKCEIFGDKGYKLKCGFCIFLDKLAGDDLIK